MTDPTPTAPEPRKAPSSNPVLIKILRYGGILAAAIAVVGAILGFVFAGWPGVAGALVGTGMAVVFCGVTAVSILLANRFFGTDLFAVAFFGIVLGGWILKFVLFIVLFLLLRDRAWVDDTVMFVALVAGVVGSLAVDVAVVATSRQSYAPEVRLPGEDED